MNHHTQPIGVFFKGTEPRGLGDYFEHVGVSWVTHPRVLTWELGDEQMFTMASAVGHTHLVI